jgi:hypothetical protein
LIVGAIVVVNAIGDIIDPSTGRVVAGMRNGEGTFADARKILRAGGPLGAVRPGEHTTIVVATNASLTKAQVNRMALMADDANARAINPAHTMGRGYGVRPGDRSVDRRCQPHDRRRTRGRVARRRGRASGDTGDRSCGHSGSPRAAAMNPAWCR